MDRLSGLTVERLTDLSARMFSSTPTVTAVGPIASLATYDEIAETLTGSAGPLSETRRLSGALMAFPAFFGPTPPVLKGDKVILRAPQMRDYREWAKLRGASRAFLEPWEPSWTADELDRGPWRQRLSRYRREFAQGSAMSLLIFENGQGRLTGGISMGNIRRGVAQTAQIGYWMGEEYAGKGYMGAAIRLLLGVQRAGAAKCG